MSKVEQWIACDLRYVAETKLGRLTDDELARLYFGLSKKHGLSLNTVSADRNVMTEKLMQLKKEIQVAYAATAAADRAQSTTEAAKAVEQIFAAGGEAEAEAEERGRGRGRGGTRGGAPGAHGGGARSQAGPRGARGCLHPTRGGRRCGARAGRGGGAGRLARHGGRAPPTARVQLQRVQVALGQRQQGVRRDGQLRRQRGARGHAQGRRAGAEVAHARVAHGRL